LGGQIFDLDLPSGKEEEVKEDEKPAEGAEEE
jgi:hypothetical protein